MKNLTIERKCKIMETWIIYSIVSSLWIIGMSLYFFIRVLKSRVEANKRIAHLQEGGHDK